MATDNTEPKTGLILQIGILCVAIIIGLRYGVVSYFNIEMGDEYQDKIGSRKSTQLVALRDEEHKMLMGGAMPIDRAMAQLAHEPRGAWGAAITPKASTDMAAMEGWSQNPKPTDPDTAAAGGMGATATAMDGGATAPTDGGVLDGGADGGPTTTAASLKDAGINPLTMGGNLVAADAGILSTKKADAGPSSVTPAAGAPKKMP